MPPAQFHSRSFTVKGPKSAFGSEKVVWTGWMLGPVGVAEENQDDMIQGSRGGGARTL